MVGLTGNDLKFSLCRRPERKFQASSIPGTLDLYVYLSVCRSIVIYLSIDGDDGKEDKEAEGEVEKEKIEETEEEKKTGEKGGTGNITQRLHKPYGS